MKTTRILAALALVAATALPGSAFAAGEKTRLGMLECEVDGGIGLIVGSSKKLQCTFVHNDKSVESYTGSINKIGLDVGVTGKSFIKWMVVTPAGSTVGDHALAGSYVGVSTGASLGIGLGANALVGGSARNIGLQPVSVEGNTGLNVAVAVSKLNLVAAN